MLSALTRRRSREDRIPGERGVVLITVLGVIMIVTLLAGALALSTMGESTISRQHAGGAQALALAEAGAYRALAEMRHRIAVDLESRIVGISPAHLLAACEANEGWRLVAEYAHPGEVSDWQEEPGEASAMLPINAGRPLAVRVPEGPEIGTISAAVSVRSSDDHPSVCRRGDATTLESYKFFVDYQVEATGQVRGARRTVLLQNPRDAQGKPVPVEVIVERASFARWALLLLESSDVWLTDTTVLDGPAHTNGRWWIWGSPAFRRAVSSVDVLVRFGNCGNPVVLETDANPVAGTICRGDLPAYQGGRLQRGAPPVTLPSDLPNLARVALGLEVEGGDPGDADLRAAAPDQTPRGQGEVPDGPYLANDNGILRHPQTRRQPGLYVLGDVERLTFLVEGGRQAVIIHTPPRKDRPSAWKVVFDPRGQTVELSATEGGGLSRTYQGAFNGLIYVDGAVKALSGTVHAQSRLTLAARDGITITDHLVYQQVSGEASGETPGSILGLYAVEGDVTIKGEDAPRDLYIDAVILAPKGKFWVEGFDRLPDKGTVTLFGGVVESVFGEFGAFDPSGGAVRGYSRKSIYDQRLLSDVTPPFFPRSERYAAPRPQPDALYDRPVWQETQSR